jgi:PAS domain S-box-containing protein
MRDAVIVVDRHHRIVDVNPATRRIVGDPDLGLIGEPVSEVLPLTSSVLASSRARAIGQEDVSIETDGEERHYELRLSDIPDADGQLMGRLIVLHDVTERTETMMRLRRQERLAAIGQLAGGIAHDFNNLLGSITLHAQLAQRKLRQQPDLVADDLEVIVHESHRAADLVAQILDFSRSAVMESEPLNLGHFLQDVASVLRRTIRENIHLVVQTPSQPCVVDADPTRIQQMLLNLATNARDAMPDGGELRIAVECLQPAPGCRAVDRDAPPGEWAHLIVSDTGTGMDEQVKDHLFEPFFTTKEPGEGTGLGLAQVYGIVSQHGGRIHVETELGEGTAFHIYFPLHDAEPVARVGEDTALEPQGTGETILLVEDEENLREASRDTLTSLGYRVLTATNGREALQRLNGRGVALVITDLVMPEMGGEALMRALGRRSPDLPVLAVTGYPIKDENEQLRDLGFCDVLQKPFDAPTLARAVHRAVNHN